MLACLAQCSGTAVRQTMSVDTSASVRMPAAILTERTANCTYLEYSERPMTAQN